MSHEQPPKQEKLTNAPDSSAGAGTSAEKLALAAKEAEQAKKDAEKKKALKESMNKGAAHADEKKAGFFTGVAKGTGIATGTIAVGFFAGIWGLFKLYGESLFGDILPKGGGGGGKKSSGGGHGGGGHGGGGHH